MGWSRLDLGVGLVALGGIDLIWPQIADLVDVVEVEPQTVWLPAAAGGWDLEPAALGWLTAIGRPLLSHGVGFPVAGTVPPDPRGVQAAAESARRLGALHWSEHLSFNQAKSDTVIESGFLLPPVLTEAGVEASVANIARYQDQLDTPFLVETPASYLRPEQGDLSDGRFVREVSERADCGILLDLHNVWANELNGRQSVAEFMAEIPLERVWELHLAGGYYLDGCYLDAHYGPVPAALLDLAAAIVPTLPSLRAIIFESVPESVASLGGPGMRKVLQALHELARLPARVADPRPVPSLAGRTRPTASLRATAEREHRLAAYTTRRSDELPSGDPRAAVLRHLTDQARLSLVTGAEPERLRWMLTHLGQAATDALLNQFLATCPASSWPAEQGAAFARWFEERQRTWGHEVTS